MRQSETRLRQYIAWETVVRAAEDVQRAVDGGSATTRAADRLAALVLLFHAQTTRGLRLSSEQP